jgi:hypothetical protein
LHPCSCCTHPRLGFFDGLELCSPQEHSSTSGKGRPPKETESIKKKVSVPHTKQP